MTLAISVAIFDFGILEPKMATDSGYTVTSIAFFIFMLLHLVYTIMKLPLLTLYQMIGTNSSAVPAIDQK